MDSNSPVFTTFVLLLLFISVTFLPVEIIKWLIFGVLFIWTFEIFVFTVLLVGFLLENKTGAE
jgi:hypothetical protein